MHETAHAPLVYEPNFFDSHRAKNFYSERVNASFNDSSGLLSKFLVLIKKVIKLSFKN